MIRDCPRCGTRMSTNDVTTKLTEYVCPSCHETKIEWKGRLAAGPSPRSSSK